MRLQLLPQIRRRREILLQVSPGAKALRARAGNDQCVAIFLQQLKCGGEFLKLRKSRRADLIAGRAIENQLDNSTLCIPG